MPTSFGSASHTGSRSRRPQPLGPGLTALLGQLAPGGHIRHAGPISGDFEPALPDNPFIPHVRKTAAARAAWIGAMPQIQAPEATAIPELSRPLPRSISPQQAYEEAVLHGKEPNQQSVLGAYSDPGHGSIILRKINEAARKTLASKENLGEPDDLTNLALLAGGGAGFAAFKGAALAGEAGLEAAAGTTAAGQVAEASRIAKVAQGVGRVASAPIRHPFATAASPVAAEVPGALTSGNPGQLLHGFAGTGVLAAALSKAGGGAQGALPGLAGAALRDAIELPAQVLPSTYLSLQAGVRAAQGHPEELEALQRGFREHSTLGNLLHGDVGGAANAAIEHPLYALLEAAGVKSAVGHGVNEALRLGGSEAAARGRQRPDINLYGDVNQQQGHYSGDFFARHGQERADARRAVVNDAGALQATPAEIKAYLRSVVDRSVYGGEQARRGHQRKGVGELHRAAPGAAADRVASLQLQGLISPDPHQAVIDLEGYRQHLIAQQPHLLPSELKVNRQLVRDIGKAIKQGPIDTGPLMDTFRQLQEPVESGLVAANQLDPVQAAERIASPYAYRFMDARYGLSKDNLAALEEVRQQLGSDPKAIGKLSELRAKEQRLGPDGEPLPLDAIHEHMRANGFDPAQIGYVGQQRAALEGEPPPPSTSYAPPNEYAQIGNKRFTGAATERGTFDASLEGLVNSWKGQRTVVDRLANFSRFMDRVGLRRPDGQAFASSTDAWYAIQHPEDLNMTLPDVPGGWVPVRVAPWLGKKELADAMSDVGKNRAAEGGFPDQATIDRAEGGEQVSTLLSEALEPGDGPVILAPKVAIDRMQQHFAKLLPAERAMQAVTGAFKGAVLPTSVTWLAGNAIDNLLIRTTGTGITPGDIRAGKAFGKVLEKELSERDAVYAIESINSGGIFGTHQRIQPYRDARQFAGTKIGPIADAVHQLLETPGPREVHRAYTAYRDAVFAFDSKFVEQTGQWGQLAKEARQELGMTRRQFRRAIADGAPAIHDLARGFRNPDTVDRYAKSIERVFGNWGKNGPAARRFLTTWAPFWQWARAATKFAFVTLPKDHPVLTGLLAASEQMTREEREKLGFAFSAAEPLPGYLQGSIPDPFQPGGVARLSNLTTFGSFGDPAQFFGANLAPPVVQGAFLAGLGMDWKGDQLVKSDGTPASIEEKAAAAALSTVDSFIPFLNVGKGLVEKGIGKTLNPIREYSPESVTSQREPRQTISVPVTGASSSSGTGNPFLEESSSTTESNPFLEEAAGSSSSSSNPFLP